MGDDWQAIYGFTGASNYYITHWPMSIKPFYIMPSPDPKYSESFDLQMGWLELTSGGTRVHNKNEETNN